MISNQKNKNISREGLADGCLLWGKNRGRAENENEGESKQVKAGQTGSNHFLNGWGINRSYVNGITQYNMRNESGSGNPGKFNAQRSTSMVVGRANSSCHRGEVFYTVQVRFSWKFMAMLMAVALLGAGCGGINATQTISPASFFLPGLLKACPPSTNSMPLVLNANEIASVR